MDLNKIKQKLADLDQAAGGGANNKMKWSPKPGKYQIRLVPYVHDKDFSFVELSFYYKLAKQTILSPASLGEPDPVQDFVDKLKSTGDSDDFKTALQIQAKNRVYTPILIRGQEEEGVKIWGFGKQVYQELLKIMDDPDYGDITDPKEGRDLTLEITKTSTYPETTIRPKPKSTVMTDSKEVLDSIKSIPRIETLWKAHTADEMKIFLEKYLNNEDESTAHTGDTDVTGSDITDSNDDDIFAKPLTTDDIPEGPKVKKDKAPVKPQSTVDDFDSLFKN